MNEKQRRLQFVERGEIRDVNRIARLRSFKSLRIGNITPTDVDAAIEFRDKAWVFLEAKTPDRSMPRGQDLFYRRLVHDLGKSKPTLLLIISQAGEEGMPIDYGQQVVLSSLDGRAQSNIYQGWIAREAVFHFLGIAKP